MKIKLKDASEIGMYYEGKRRKMPDSEIELSIRIIRIIQEL
jgi:hypothetical protein